MAVSKNKNMGCLIGAIFGVSVLATGLIGGVTLLSNRKTIITLEQSIEQQYMSNKSNYDSMVKAAREMVQVTDMYAEDFERIYSNLISGRYKGEEQQQLNSLFKVVQESNPTLDSSVYTTLQRELSANRKTFDSNQTKVLDRIREYNTFVETKFITSAVFNKQKIDSSKYIVTSESTEDAFNSGKADEINLRGE